MKVRKFLGNHSSLLISTLLFLYLFSPTMAQAKIFMNLSATTLEVNVGGTKTVTVTLQNLGSESDIFGISVWPPEASKFGIYVDVPPRVELAPGEKVEIPLKFYTPECTLGGEVVFKVTAFSLTKPEEKSSEQILMKVRGEGLTCITRCELNKERFYPGEKVSVKVSVSNFAESGNFSLEILVKKDGDIKKIFREGFYLERKGGRDFVSSFQLPEWSQAGDYKVYVLLKKDERIVSSKLLSFSVMPVEKFAVTTSMKNMLLIQSYVVKIRNVGNAPSSPKPYTLNISKFLSLFFRPETKPTETYEKEGKVTYVWEVPSLNPNREYEIRYSFDYTLLLLLAVVAIAVTVISYARYYSIKVVKKIKPVKLLSREKEIPITLSVANHSRHVVKDVIVKDRVPPLAALVEKFETLKPVKRKTKKGVELVWRIPSLKPGEEVILSYRIKPVVDIVGSLRLPEATVQYVGRGRKKRVTISKPVVVLPRKG